MLLGAAAGGRACGIDRRGRAGKFEQLLHPGGRFAKAIARQRTRVGAPGNAFDGVVLELQGVADQHGVRAGGDGQLGSVHHPVGVGDGLHLQVVGDARAFELDVLAEELHRLG